MHVCIWKTLKHIEKISIPSYGILMARTPNYSFERQERDRLKAEKKAKRAAEKKAARETNPEPQDQPKPIDNKD